MRSRSFAHRQHFLAAKRVIVAPDNTVAVGVQVFVNVAESGAESFELWASESLTPGQEDMLNYHVIE